MAEQPIYNTNLAKGTGLINESLILIEEYQETDDKGSFLKRCLEFNILNKATEKRTKDIINLVFFDRYWKETNVILFLKEVRENGLNLYAFKLLLCIYTARANPIFLDLILQVQKENKIDNLNKAYAIDFIRESIASGKAPEWSEGIISRVASYLMSCFKDFELLDDSGLLNLNPRDSFIVNYIAHELHFEGKSDLEILNDNIWLLLGLSRYRLVEELRTISYRDTFIFQYSGEIIRINWKYTSMQEFIENESR